MTRERVLYHFKRAIFKVSPKLAEELGFDFRMNIPDRSFLEKQVFGFINIKTYGKRAKCLFIGLKKYNWHYPRLLDCEYHSLDIDAKMAVYGVKATHIVGSALSLTDYYNEKSFSFVIANGLIGFGIDSELVFTQMLYQIHNVLEEDGVLVIGYNNEPSRLTFDIENSLGSSLFERFSPPISGVYDTPHEIQDSFKHCYLFLKKVSNHKA